MKVTTEGVAIKKTLAELNLNDDFLFGRILSDPELCKLFLEKTMEIKIKQIKISQRQWNIRDSLASKGVILDIYAEDENGTVYNIEVQNENRDIAKRSRYYSSMIDMEMLPSGKKYHKLRNTVIIFLNTFDLLGAGLHRYTVRKRPDELLHRVVDDGTYEVYLNTRGTADDVDAELKEFLYYVEHTTDQVAEASTSEMVKQFHKKVKQVRKDRRMEVEYMRFQEILEEQWESGLEEGMEKGLEEGVEKGIRQTAEKLLRLGTDLDVIMKATNYSREEIESMEQNLPSYA